MLVEILTALLPLVLAVMKDNLPRIATFFLDKWLSYKPKTAVDNALIQLDEAIVEGDLLTLGAINATVLDLSGANDLTLEQLKDMEKLIND